MSRPIFNALDGLSIRDVIDMRAAAAPDHLFLIDPTSGKSLSYSDLKNACQSVTGHLREKGAKPGDTVGYALTN